MGVAQHVFLVSKLEAPPVFACTNTKEPGGPCGIPSHYVDEVLEQCRGGWSAVLGEGCCVLNSILKRALQEYRPS
jgi:hypothetical protein